MVITFCMPDENDVRVTRLVNRPIKPQTDKEITKQRTKTETRLSLSVWYRRGEQR